MTDLVIKMYDNNYFGEVIKLLNRSFEINSNIKVLENNDNSFSIIALVDDKVVGHIRIDKLKNIGKDCYYYLLNYICVDSDFQNMNIGSMMLDFIFEKAKKDSVSYIELTSKAFRKAANHLYLKNGFIIRETNVFMKNI